MKTTKQSLPPLKTLPVFIAVAKHLSFSQAANELNVTHSAVSQSIRSLETFLNVKLFNRRPNKQITLTIEGERYFTEIHSAINTIIDATQKQLGMASNNLLTVNIPTTLTMRWLIPRLPKFQAMHPNIDLRLSTLGRAVDFNRDNIDIGITYRYEEDSPNQYTQKLFDDQLVLVASEKIIPSHYKLGTLFQHVKSIYVDTDLRKHDWEWWCKLANIKEPRKSNRIYFQNSTQALQATTNGIGIMVTHKPFIVDDIQSGQLKQLSNTTPQLGKSYYLVCPQEKLNTQKITNFCQWLLAEAKITDKNLKKGNNL